MLQSHDAPARTTEPTLTPEDCLQMEKQFAERAHRVEALFELDSALSAAANRYSLAAQVVHFGWPHRAD